MKRIVSTAAIMVLMSGSAYAKGVLTAGPITSVVSHTYRCFAVNASTKPVDISVKTFDYNGTEGPGHTCLAVPAGDTCFIDASSLDYCRIEHTAGKTGVRATVEEMNSGIPGRTIVAQ